MTKLTHVSKDGEATMVDVSEKAVTKRVARASAFVSMNETALALLAKEENPKGDPLETCRIAGITAAKRTWDLIPLCHPLLLEHVDVKAEVADGGVAISSSVTMTGKTGAEMEALTAASVAALTVYDMCKAVDKGMVITHVRLEEKTGGKSGRYVREEK